MLNRLHLGTEASNPVLLARRPRSIEFNFARHDGQGHAASWAGPVDDIREHAVKGILVIAQE
jgi:hypothetical protein